MTLTPHEHNVGNHECKRCGCRHSEYEACEPCPDRLELAQERLNVIRPEFQEIDRLRTALEEKEREARLARAASWAYQDVASKQAQRIAELEAEIKEWKLKHAESEAGLYDLAVKSTLASNKLAAMTAERDAMKARAEAAESDWQEADKDLAAMKAKLTGVA